MINIKVILEKDGQTLEHSFQYDEFVSRDLDKAYGMCLEAELAKFVCDEILHAIAKLEERKDGREM